MYSEVLDKKFKESFTFSSANFQNELNSLNEILEWLKGRENANSFLVEEIPFNKLEKWSFNPSPNCYLKHDSGKFFRIEGLRVETDFGEVPKWEQAIINQPEIGILGIVTKVINGVRHFLMQAKMEPGNINILQISPTLQATKSNFNREHKGKAPLYLEYFADKSKAKILVDQLQTEQGARFLQKRNRNVLVEVSEDIQLHEDFYWLTLRQLKQLMKIDNLINMDSRSVLACVPYINEIDSLELVKENPISIEAENKEIASYDIFTIDSICATNSALHTEDEIIGWITSQKVKYHQKAETISLDKVSDWEITETEIKHKYEPRFSIVAINVKAGNREVSSWTQPIVKDLAIGLIGFLIKTINGIDHYLVQAKFEIGNVDIIDLAPTVSFSNYQYRVEKGNLPAFSNYFLKPENVQVKYDCLLSEEGGRFYHMQNRYMIIKTEQISVEDIPSNYMWLTLGQILKFAKTGHFNIEARSLLACIDILKYNK